MTAFRIYKHDITLFKALSGTNPSRVPADNWTVDIYRRGATASQAKSIGTGGGITLSVYDIGDIQVNDTLQIGANSAGTRLVSAITNSTITFGPGGTGSFSPNLGSRLVITNTRPTIYSDAAGINSLGSSTSTDLTGMATFYSKTQVVDCIFSDGQGTLVLEQDQTGAATTSDTPFQWNAAGDGSTNDAVAFQSLIARAVADGVQRISIPPGTYQINSTITIPGLSGIVIAASAPGQVVVSFGHLAGAGFDLTGACADVGFEDIFFSTTTANTSIIQTSTTTSRFFARRCTFLVSTNRTGIIEQGSDGRIVDCVFSGTSPGTWVRLNGAQRAQLQGCFGTWAGNPSGRVIDIDTGCRGIRLLNCDFRGNSTGNSAAAGVVGLRNSGAGTAPRDTVLVGCHFGAGTSGRGVDIDACQGFQAIGCTIEDSMVGYSIDNGTMIRIIGGLIVGCQNEGIDFNGGSHIRISGLDISDINQSNTSKNYIDIASGLDDISIMDCTVGTFIRNSGISGAYGVSVQGLASDRIQVLGMRSDGSLGSGMIFSASTSQVADYSHIFSGTSVFHTAYPNKDQDGTPLIGIKFMTGAETTTDVTNIHTLILNQSGNTTWTNLTNGLNGQVVRILNVHATSTAAFANGASLRMATSPRTLDQGDILTLMFSTNLGKWAEVGYSAT